MRALTIAGTTITDDSPAFVIAEIGHNHGGSVKTACDMIRAAKACGASAVKLQKRENATLYHPRLLAQPYEHENSFGATYGQHRQALEFNFTQYVSCRAVAQSVQIPFFATAFDEASLKFLLDLGVPAIKLASGSVTDRPLVQATAQTGLPVILSTGGSTDQQIDQAVEWLANGRSPFALLHCTAAYPVLNWQELNLRCITTLRERYPETVIGWSGHDSGIAMATAAYTLGARILEKHFTLNRASKGTDHAFSLEPAGLKKLVRDLGRTREALGDGVKRIYDSERGPIAKMRRVETPDGWMVP